MKSITAAMILEAAHFAAERHKGQFRRDGVTPYINHPLEVATTLASKGGIDDPVVLAGALLHDTLEDTATTADELRRFFGEKVASVVEELTNDALLPKAKRKEEQVSRAATYSPEAAAVRCADEICNLRSVIKCPPPNWSTARCAAYAAWMERVVAAMPPVAHPLEKVRREALRCARKTFGPDTGEFTYDQVGE